MRNSWLPLLTLTSIAWARNNDTTLGAQVPTAASSTTEVPEQAIQAQDYGKPMNTCKTTSTVYEYGRPSTSTTKVTVTHPQTCPKVVPSTSTKTVTTTVTPSRGYEVLPPPITVTVTKTRSVANSGGYGLPPVTITITSIGSCSARPPVTISDIRTTTKVCFITMFIKHDH